MRRYPAYRLEDFYRKSYLDGGVTFDQLFFMFEDSDREEYEDRRFFAAIQGIDIDDDKPRKSTNNSPHITDPVHNNGPEKQFLFKDPAEYDLMSEEQKAAETNKMKKFWEGFAENKKM